MKNKEKFAKDIVESAIKGDHYFAYDKTLKRVVPCCGTSCNNCLFYDGKKSCKINRLNWANAEYKELKRFTEREKAFVAMFPRIKYVARDGSGIVWFYADKPHKINQLWTCPDVYCLSNSCLFDVDFLSIQWEDEEPTSREEILREWENEEDCFKHGMER